jgi:hypothetical protein
MVIGIRLDPIIMNSVAVISQKTPRVRKTMVALSIVFRFCSRIIAIE